MNRLCFIKDSIDSSQVVAAARDSEVIFIRSTWRDIQTCVKTQFMTKAEVSNSQV